MVCAIPHLPLTFNIALLWNFTKLSHKYARHLRLPSRARVFSYHLRGLLHLALGDLWESSNTYLRSVRISTLTG
jgi:hypothetical protein